MLNNIKNYLQSIDGDCEKIDAINEIKLLLSEFSPLSHNPVDCVIWVKSEQVYGNDYNPNNVAPPEMALLEDSIREDGFTQPIVTFKELHGYEIVDGFHRSKIGAESKFISLENSGYVPVTIIKNSRSGAPDRMTSTIRHNKARGTHGTQAMSDIVIELKRRGWSEARISKKLGMELEEIHSLNAVHGLLDLVKGMEYSKSWVIE